MKSKHQRFYSDIRFQDTIKPTTGHKTLKISKKKNNHVQYPNIDASEHKFACI